MANQPSELDRLINSELKTGTPFQPFADYNEAGDCVRFLVKPDNYYRERIDGLITAYVSFASGDIIGAQIKGIQKLLAEAPAIRMYAITRGKVTLEMIITTAMVIQGVPEEVEVPRYAKLIEASRRAPEVSCHKDACGAAAD